jgi:hypothetical protein
MARVQHNLITMGLQGSLGAALVFRTVNGQTYVSKKPEFSGNWSPAQLENRQKLQRAMAFAREVKQQPELLARYQQAAGTAGGFTNATSLLVRDFYHAPRVTGVVATGFTGAAGSTLEITAIDDFRVVRVAVQVLTLDRKVLAEGNAELREGDVWQYTLLSDLPKQEKVLLRVVAFDLPRNSGELEQIIEWSD